MIPSKADNHGQAAKPGHYATARGKKGRRNMATLEFIQKRMEGKRKELAKLEKKMARIQDAAASGWENNPYCYSEYDLSRTQKEIQDARAALEDYTAQLKTETDKANSRNVPAIVDFLNGWKARCMDFYKGAFPDYLRDREAWFQTQREYGDWWNGGGCRESLENRKERKQAYHNAESAFKQKWNFIVPYTTLEGASLILDEKKLARELDDEANRKYDFIIQRVTKITGEITDASGLSVGDKGDLNGWIQGASGTAKVETIGAGGYNIQCFHFRTLIKKVG